MSSTPEEDLENARAISSNLGLPPLQDVCGCYTWKHEGTGCRMMRQQALIRELYEALEGHAHTNFNKKLCTKCQVMKRAATREDK